MEEATTPSSPRCRSKEPWLWVIEYLSIFPQIPASLLHDMIKAAPRMPNEDGKMTIDMVALRCLEDLSTHEDDPATHGLPCGTPDHPIDPLLTCDAALQAIINSKSPKEPHGGGAGVSGREIQTFTRRKRASMPKCTLQLLRDGTLGVRCRPTTSLAEATSDLRDDGMGNTEPVNCDDGSLAQLRSDKRGSDVSRAMETEENTVDYTLENGDGAAGDALSDEILPPSLTHMSSLANEEAADSGGQNLYFPRSDDVDTFRASITKGDDALLSSRNENGLEFDYLDHENTLPAKRDRKRSVDREQDIADVIDDCHFIAKRVKSDWPHKNPTVEQVSLSHRAEHIGDDVSGMMADNVGDKYFVVENQRGLDGPHVMEIMSLGRGHGDCPHIAQLKRTPDCNADPDVNHEIELDQNHKHGASIIPEDTLVNGHSTDVLVDESGHAATMPPRDIPSVQNLLPADSVDELKDLNDCSLKPTSSMEFCQNTTSDEEECSMERNCAEDKSYNTDKFCHLTVDVAMMKDQFLSSRCSPSDDYLARVDWKKHNLCTKCNLDGQLLTCSTVGCPLVVHENCLGSSPKYKNLDFCCPFCAYSIAISELEEALKKASLARKKLTAFMHEEPPSKSCKVDGNSRRNQKEGPLQNIDNNGHLEDGRGYGNLCAVNEHHSNKSTGNLQQVALQRSCSDANIISEGGPRHMAAPSDNSIGKKVRGRSISEEEPVEEPGRLEECIRVDPKSSDIASSEDNRVASNNGRPDEEACLEFSEQEAAELLENLASAVDEETDKSYRPRRSQRIDKKCTYADQVTKNLASAVDEETDKSNRPRRSPRIDKKCTYADPVTKNIASAVDEETDKSNRPRRSQRTDKKCTYADPAKPQLKRKKVPWTAEEEEMLKEGVQKFTTASDLYTPWKTILDYGTSVFWKGRTTVDLKDKWRNICKSRR